MTAEPSTSAATPTAAPGASLAGAPAPTARSIPWWHATVGPWVYVLCPQRAAQTQLRAGRWAFAVACVANLLVAGATVVGLRLAEELVTPFPFMWSSPVSPGNAAYRTVAEIWAQWGEGRVHVALVTVGVVLAISGAALLVLAWLNLPRVHRAGAILPSVGRSLRAAAAALGFITVVGTPVALAIIDIDGRYRPGGSVLRRALPEGVDPALILAPVVLASIALLLWWLGRAVMAAAEAEGEPAARVPVCEGCGYDLTHRPADGRCPECGFRIEISVTAGRQRRPVPWERQRTVESWYETAFTALFLPRDFHGHAAMRTGQTAAARFAVGQYVLIGVLAMVWAVAAIVALNIRHGPGPSNLESCLITTTFGLGTALGCWLGHKAIGALVMTWWLIRGQLPDYGAAGKVIAYEAVFLWVFCAFWGVFATTLVVGDLWLTDLFGSRLIYVPIGMPPEAAVLLFGTLVLAAVWLWRYEVAYRRIRWSNF